MKIYRFRVHTGPSYVAEFAERLWAQGVSVTSIGTEHIYFKVSAPDANAARVQAELHAKIATLRSTVEALGEAA